jgi:hypothetical protein
MKKDEIKTLLEMYFEGLTSLKEEQQLRDYFQSENIPKEWEMYQPFFRFFSEEQRTVQDKQALPIRDKASKRSLFRFYWRISIAVAACLFLFFGWKLTQNAHKNSWAYINGKKYTDIEQIRTEILKTLENFSDENENVYASQIEVLELFIE